MTGVSQQQHLLPVIFLAFANEPHRYLARLADEARALRESWQTFRDRGYCEVVWLTNVTRDEIFATFRTYRDRIVLFHYGGHADSYRLLLEAGGGQTTPMDATAFADFLAGQQGLRLVFLNGCSTRAQVAALQEAGSSAVIATEQDIRDDVAVDFARAFYQGLVSDATLQIAFNQAAAEVRSRLNLDGTARHLRAVPDVDPIKAEPPWTLHCRPAAVADWRWAQLVLAPSFARKAFEPETLLVPAGPFLMGEGEAQHEVTLTAYRIGKYPVTNDEYAVYVRQTGATVPPAAGWVLAAVGQVPAPSQEQHPIVGVSWDDAVAYCRWLTKGTDRAYRLPTEAEWEKAASWVADAETESVGKKGRKVVYAWGDSFDAQKCNAQPTGIGHTTPVGAYSAQGDSPTGCADMAGNVWEWTNTRWGRDRAVADYSYPYDPDDGREKAEAILPYREYRICRGGSFRSSAKQVTTTARTRYAANSNNATDRGFRIAMDIN